MRYEVIDAQGWFGGNRARVYSTHRTLDLAIRAARRHSYTDEHGQKRCPACVVLGEKYKGEHYWGDRYPKVLWPTPTGAV